MAGALDAFKKAATKPSTKKKSDKIELNEPQFDGAIEQWVKAAAAEKTAKADKAEAESEFLDTVEAKRIDASVNAGQNLTTVLLNGKLSISKSKRYSKVEPEHLPALKEIFGEKDAERYFRTRLNVAVKPSVLDSEEKAAKLIELIGPHIEEFFDVVETLEVMEVFHNERSTNPDVAEKAGKAMDERLIKNAKAAVKLA